MISFALLFCLLGCWCHYAKSQKTKIEKTFLENWIGEHHLPAKLATFIFLLLSYSLFYAEYGLISGLFVFFTALSLLLSLLILGRPLNTPNLSILLFIFLVSLFSEIFI